MNKRIIRFKIEKNDFLTLLKMNFNDLTNFIIKGYPKNGIKISEIKDLLKYALTNHNIIYFKNAYSLLLEHKILTKKICYHIRYFDSFNFLCLNARIKPSNYMFLKIMRCKNHYVIPYEFENIYYVHFIHKSNVCIEQLFCLNFNPITEEINITSLCDILAGDKLLIFTDDYLNGGGEMIEELQKLFCFQIITKNSVFEILTIENNVKKRINALLFIETIKNTDTALSKVFNILKREIIKFL